MPVTAASLANLQPPYARGNTAPRRSRDVTRSLVALRRCCPAAVKWATDVLDTECELIGDNADMDLAALKTRVALAVIDKCIPGVDSKNASATLGDFVGSISIHIERHAPPASPTIDAEPAEQLTIRTITIGRGDND